MSMRVLRALVGENSIEKAQGTTTNQSYSGVTMALRFATYY